MPAPAFNLVPEQIQAHEAKAHRRKLSNLRAGGLSGMQINAQARRQDPGGRGRRSGDSRRWDEAGTGDGRRVAAREHRTPQAGDQSARL